MRKKMVTNALPIALLAFAIFFILLFPLYRFVFDQDSIGYSAVAERVASGNFFKSINGLWSPLSSWLVVPLIKLGIDPILGFKYVNGFTGLLLLISTWYLLKKFSITDHLKAVIIYTCVPVFLSYCFYELCADFLLLLLFTLYLIQVCSNDFFTNNKRQFICAVIAVFAYLSKAYFFPFFLAHFTIINFYYYKRSIDINKAKRYVQNLFIGFITFFTLISPWIYALSKKYHYLTYSNAGKYNAYLHLHPGTEYTKLLLGPPYPDAYNSWDDPWLPFMQHFSPFSSASTIFLQIKLFFLNIISSIPFFSEISFLSIAIIAAVLFLWLSKTSVIKIPENIFVCAITSILMPAGYFLFHLETRFIWILSILSLIMGSYLITAAFGRFRFSSLQKIFVTAVFVASFIIYPLLSLKNNVYNGKEAYAIANSLKKGNVKGKIMSNHLNPEQYTLLLMASVIAKNQFYNYSRGSFSTADIEAAIKEFGIDYYLFSYTRELEKENFLTSTLCKNAALVNTDLYPGIVVVKLK
ncbi:hypothetical protein LK994_08925 [Ferruginibacter lapsinanis]|uniref:hypothetical protein n=1 Tax=Ferruginibacter lapsinanis TaxID=563172 RepID=UPI001E3EE670|nr:hypothetical protein [Ferruginibacter lapsinanis]UEG48759.1 hypothetical protein LK994_08925 [Ferruginibacter lapsinanis]